MNWVKAAILVTVIAIAAAGCGSGGHVRFSTVSQVCGLSVPEPQGFHRRFWSRNHSTAGGVTISHGRLLPPVTPGAAHRRLHQVSLTVSWNVGVIHGLSPGLQVQKLPSRVTLQDLARAGPGLPLWGRSFEVGDRGCGIEVWLGQDASSGDRAAVLSALEAIKAGS